MSLKDAYFQYPMIPREDLREKRKQFATEFHEKAAHSNRMMSSSAKEAKILAHKLNQMHKDFKDKAFGITRTIERNMKNQSGGAKPKKKTSVRRKSPLKKLKKGSVQKKSLKKKNIVKKSSAKKRSTKKRSIRKRLSKSKTLKRMSKRRTMRRRSKVKSLRKMNKRMSKKKSNRRRK